MPYPILAALAVAILGMIVTALTLVDLTSAIEAQTALLKAMQK